MAPVASDTLGGGGESSGKRRKTVFVVGLGMTGIAFIEKLLKMDESDEYFIRTCGEESFYAYNRVGLTEYFEHRVS
jgi:nitrite reductase (NAD(P)H)